MSEYFSHKENYFSICFAQKSNNKLLFLTHRDLFLSICKNFIKNSVRRSLPNKNAPFLIISFFFSLKIISVQKWNKYQIEQKTIFSLQNILAWKGLYYFNVENYSYQKYRNDVFFETCINLTMNLHSNNILGFYYN